MLNGMHASNALHAPNALGTSITYNQLTLAHYNTQYSEVEEESLNHIMKYRTM